MSNVHQVAALVPMTRLLGALGFVVTERTRRGPCILHSGSNPTAFAWRHDGRWRCFSCGRSGDRIALVQSVQQSGFHEAVKFLAALAGVEYRGQRLSRAETKRREALRGRAERAAWKLTDEIVRLRIYNTDALHRADRLCCRLGVQLSRAASESEREKIWDRLARLAPAQTFFLAAWTFMSQAKPEALAHFALAMPSERRRILEGDAP